MERKLYSAVLGRERVTPAALLAYFVRMPLEIERTAPTLIIRREAFERVGLTRAQIDERWNLTPDEFRVEGSLIAIGPLHGEHDVGAIVEEMEATGLAYFDEMFELTGNWPEWLRILALPRR